MSQVPTLALGRPQPWIWPDEEPGLFWPVETRRKPRRLHMTSEGWRYIACWSDSLSHMVLVVCDVTQKIFASVLCRKVGTQLCCLCIWTWPVLSLCVILLRCFSRLSPDWTCSSTMQVTFSNCAWYRGVQGIHTLTRPLCSVWCSLLTAPVSRWNLDVLHVFSMLMWVSCGSLSLNSL